MKKSKFTETQIIKAIKENEAGRKNPMEWSLHQYRKTESIGLLKLTVIHFL